MLLISSGSIGFGKKSSKPERSSKLIFSGSSSALQAKIGDSKLILRRISVAQAIQVVFYNQRFQLFIRIFSHLSFSKRLLMVTTQLPGSIANSLSCYI
jgi:hypothetical protein